MFISTKEKLTSPLELVNSVVVAKPILPAYAYILMEGTDGDLWMTASDGEVTIVTSVETQIEAEFACCIPAKHFADLVKLFGGDFSVEEHGEGRVLVRHGKARHKIPILPNSAFPEVQPINGRSISIPGNLLRNMILATEFAVDSRPDGKYPAMRGIHATTSNGQLYIVGCDGVRMAIASTLIGGECDVTIPSKAVSVFARFADSPGDVELVPQENQVCLRGERGNVISRRIIGQFPNWELVIPKDLKHHVEMSSASLTTAIRRVGLATSSHDSTDGPAFACKFTITDTEMIIEARSEGRGEGEEHIDIKCPTLAGEEPVIIGVAGKQILDFLKVVNQGNLVMSFKDPDTSLVFTPRGALGFEYKYLTMPCRLKF